ncbi:type II secretion system protein GspD [Synechococcus sp. EJ6-Ellesmere]|uniref:type II secretion system protein GspD n=1 Tax=Synechococcus sp. EJ6-Ellesmere TaxID=2823734 RepID=UPI0020CF8694|nr:general secretion pathway protein GspD [Synechococcus sp. EJ6-Ellesmere]MCP9826656.1 general secretion pathway protein GspD [Synechococcus sp. EJ6-Ellesmere]
MDALMGSAGLGFRAGLWLVASSTLLATLPLAVTPAPVLAQAAIRSDGLQLKLRRLPDALELLIQDVGTGSDLRQQMHGQVWLGELRTPQVRGLKAGPQSLSMTDAGVDSITFDGTGTEFQLKVTPMQGRNLGTPVVSSDGRDLTVRFIAPQLPVSQTARVDLRAPTRVPTSSFVPPLRPRAVAPPSGDIAVGTMTIRNRGYLSLYGPPVTLTTRSANPRDVLMVLAQMGGYGYAYQDTQALGSFGGTNQGSIGSPQRCGVTPRNPLLTSIQTNSSGQGSQGQGVQDKPFVPCPVSVAFLNEPYERAFNFVLLSSGLQARKEGSTILVGPSVLGSTLGPQMSKVYRLNQVGAKGAAEYLASLGAIINVPNTSRNVQSSGQATSVGAGVTGGGSTASSTSTSQSETTTIQSFGSGIGPLVGLSGTIDDRLSTITIVGEPSLVAIGEQYLKQLDLRQRQVALSVKILDVNLTNASDIDNSFAFRFGNNFIVNDGGRLLAAFGRNLPPTANDFRRGVPNNLDVELTPGTGTTPGTITTTGDNLPGLVATGAAALNGATSTGSSLVDGFRRNPGLNYPDNQFFDFLQAQIVSENAKVLASPTLILSENPETIAGGADIGAGGLSGQAGDTSGLSAATIGRTRSNESFVTVGRQVVTAYDVTSTANVGTTCEPTFSTAGLTFGARVSKIDDNGFVTFTLSPAISGVVNRQQVPGCGDIDILRLRRLDTGSVRVRDGQTLILTGVISDEDFEVVSKWPILGDLPLLGQFFRKTTGSRNKSELVILVTPRIIDDEQGGTYGYGYNPSGRDARRLIYSP